MEDERLDALLLRWEELTEAGQVVSADELCRDCPELTDELRQRIEALRRVAWVADPRRQAPVASRFTVLAPDSEPVPGYHLIQRLGRGGFAEVWKAEGPAGPVALKFVPLTDDAARVEWRSLEVLKHITHPNLLPTYGSWQVDGFLAVAMQLADRTLYDRWREARAQGLPGIPKDELVRYFHDAAAGIDFLQKRYIQHRDVKPQNLLLVGDSVKVGDFGLTRLLGNSVTRHTGAFTLAYAAPEFFEGKTTRHSDQYSLAVTYCQMRGGRLPFEGTPAAMVAAHLHRTPDLSMLPAEERPALARALAKRPGDRWPTCQAFVEAVADPKASSRALARGRRVRLRGKWPWLLAAAGILVLALLFFPRPRPTPTVTVRYLDSVENAHFIRSADVTLLPPPTDRLVALSNGSGSPVLWDVTSGKVLRKLPYEEGGACAAVAPVQIPRGATGHEDGTIILWDLHTGKEVRRLTGHRQSVSSLAFSADAGRLLSGSCDGTVRLWDTRSGEELQCMRGHTGFVMSVAFDGTGRYALSGSYDGTVRLWDLEGGDERKRFEGHGSHVLAVALSPDGRLAASGGRDRTLRLWDTAGGKEVRRFEAHSEAINAVFWLAHDRLVVADGNEVRFLETDGGRDWLRCPPQPSRVQSLGFTGLPGKICIVIGTAENGVGVCEVPR